MWKVSWLCEKCTIFGCSSELVVDNQLSVYDTLTSLQT